MNERIRELAEQAGMTDDKFGMFFAKDKHDEDGVDLEKFSELIVKSVMADLEKLRAEYANPDMYESVEYYDRQAAKESALEEALDTIRYNFGVDK
jgi:hypothetical protein